jgi:hypothetical protein
VQVKLAKFIDALPALMNEMTLLPMLRCLIIKLSAELSTFINLHFEAAQSLCEQRFSLDASLPDDKVENSFHPNMGHPERRHWKGLFNVMRAGQTSSVWIHEVQHIWRFIDHRW